MPYGTIYHYYQKYKNKTGDEEPEGKNAGRKLCRTCIYRGRPHKNGCDYIDHTGKRRGCSVDDCDKYERGERLEGTQKVSEL